MPLILASASPRRAELLTSAGFSFDVRPADVDESRRDGEPPERYVERVAHAKARAVARACAQPGTVVLGADTVVVIRGELLGKPASASDAARMLRLLAGAVHEVLTAVVLVDAGSREDERVREVARTRVRFLPLTGDEIAWYVETGEPFGKAGGYAIQGRAARFVEWIDGSWSNVVGLPVATVDRLLKTTDGSAILRGITARSSP
ncbi:MAG TPA: Maf family protein [Vicinamibacterales bacterium]|nr:Maf family protein [Vicinamibacterales bacterium]